MKPEAREKASDTLEDFDEEIALDAGQFLFFGTSHPGSIEPAELAARESGAEAGGDAGSGVPLNFFSSDPNPSSQSSELPTAERSPHFSEEAEPLELESDIL